jgi:hypothetical protein
VFVILAAAVTVASGPVSLPPAPLLPETRIVRMDAQACKTQGTYQVSDPALLYRDDGSARASQLADLPKANHEKAVVRMIGPCANPLVVRYGAGR